MRPALLTRNSPERPPGGGVCDGRIAITEARARIAELRGVGYVEDLSPQPKSILGPDREAPLHSQIEVVLTRSAHQADAAVAEVLIGKAGPVRSLRRSGKRSRIEISVGPNNSREQRTTGRWIARRTLGTDFAKEKSVHGARIAIEDTQRRTGL